jgi:hypothetical protein
MLRWVEGPDEQKMDDVDQVIGVVGLKRTAGSG